MSVSMIDLNGIRNIVFDLGGVLLRLDFDASITAFYQMGFDKAVPGREQAFTDKAFYELETGKIIPEMFRDRIRELLGNTLVPDREIDNAWCAMILDIPSDRVEILRKLKSIYNLYLFSNTNMIHINRLHEWFREKYGSEFSSLFVRDIYSHEIHDRKPDRSAFTKVIDITGINPAESLFIDDHEKNITGAAEAGFRTFWLQEEMDPVNIFQSLFYGKSGREK